MNLQLNLNYLYFSATGYTKMIIREIGESVLQEYLSSTEIEQSIIKNKQHTNIFECDFTLPENRAKKISFTSNDLVIVGVPVYAGRVPNLLLPFINSIDGGGAKAIAVVTFGNRSFDDALSELSHILVNNNFTLLGGGAFVAEHAFSSEIANGRPNTRDFTQMKEFSLLILRKYLSADSFITEIPGKTLQDMQYYKPIGEGKSIDIRKVKPLTSSTCNSCGVCATVCPMGAIDINNPKDVIGICIKCGACVQQCRVGAKYFNDKDYIYHVEWLVRECGCRDAKNFIFV